MKGTPDIQQYENLKVKYEDQNTTLKETKNELHCSKEEIKLFIAENARLQEQEKINKNKILAFEKELRKSHDNLEKLKGHKISLEMKINELEEERDKAGVKIDTLERKSKQYGERLTRKSTMYHKINMDLKTLVIQSKKAAGSERTHSFDPSENDKNLLTTDYQTEDNK